MAKVLKKIFIPTTDEVVQNFPIESWHVSQSVDAFTGAEAYDILLSGSLTVTGSVAINGLTNTSQNNVLTYNTSTGLVYYTSSNAFASTSSANPAPLDTYIQYNAGGAFGANSGFRFNYNIASFQHGNGVQAAGGFSYASGQDTTSSGQYSHTEGCSTKATGLYSHAEGRDTIASGEASHAEGRYSTASGDYSHAEGGLTLASNSYAHTEGFLTRAIVGWAHAEGESTLAGGLGSHTEGQYTTASGNASYAHAEGLGTVANGNYQHVMGSYNISSSNATAFIIGNGATSSSRSNLVYASGSLVQITGSTSITSTLTTSGSRVRRYRTVTLTDADYDTAPSSSIQADDDIILIIDNTEGIAPTGEGNLNITNFLNSSAGRCVEIVKVKDGIGSGIIILNGTMAGNFLNLNNISETNGIKTICSSLGSSITLMSMGLTNTGSAWGNGY
jgi:hypothetical protein